MFVLGVKYVSVEDKGSYNLYTFECVILHPDFLPDFGTGIWSRLLDIILCDNSVYTYLPKYVLSGEPWAGFDDADWIAPETIYLSGAKANGHIGLLSKYLLSTFTAYYISIKPIEGVFYIPDESPPLSGPGYFEIALDSGWKSWEPSSGSEISVDIGYTSIISEYTQYRASFLYLFEGLPINPEYSFLANLDAFVLQDYSETWGNRYFKSGFPYYSVNKMFFGGALPPEVSEDNNSQRHILFYTTLLPATPGFYLPTPYAPPESRSAPYLRWGRNVVNPDKDMPFDWFAVGAMKLNSFVVDETPFIVDDDVMEVYN